MKCLVILAQDGRGDLEGEDLVGPLVDAGDAGVLEVPAGPEGGVGAGLDVALPAGLLSCRPVETSSSVKTLMMLVERTISTTRAGLKSGHVGPL